MKVKSEGGILLPNTTKKKSQFGTVVAVGPGGFNLDGSRKPMSVKEGDMVFFTEDYYITEVEGNVVIVDEEGILGVVKE